MEEVEKQINAIEQTNCLAPMTLEIIDFLRHDPEAVLQVQYRKTGDIFQLSLNRNGGLCYLIPVTFGYSKKLVGSEEKNFILTDESKTKVTQYAEMKRRKREKTKENVAGLTIRTYERVSGTAELVNIAESPEKNNNELLEVLDRVVAMTKNYRVYKDSGRLYFVCNCKTDADGFALKNWLSRKGGFEVWGEGTDIQFKKNYSEDVIWEAQWDYGLVVHS